MPDKQGGNNLSLYQWIMLGVLVIGWGISWGTLKSEVSSLKESFVKHETISVRETQVWEAESARLLERIHKLEVEVAKFAAKMEGNTE